MGFTLLAENPESASAGVRTLHHMQRKTKIVCTIGPACQEPEQIRELMLAGAAVFRMNFSHSTHEWHSEALKNIRQQADFLELPIAIMQDLCGPKIRLSKVVHDEYKVEIGDTIRITTDHYLRQSSNPPDYDIAITYSALLNDVKINDTLLLADGRIELVVREKEPGLLIAETTRGGRILVGKGLNLPGVDLSTPSVTEKDWKDLEWGVRNEADFVALSFVRHPDDLTAVKTYLEQQGSNAQLIAKIERPEAIQHIERIVDLADALMVARGDLGLETDLARVPLLQKEIIEYCRQEGKPVITATQMLDSMVNTSAPTRAEVSDVANAIFDGSDAVMLSDETAAGKYPKQAVSFIERIALATEKGLSRVPHPELQSGVEGSAVGAITEAAATAALLLKAKRVVVYSQTGYTARMMARFRLPMPVAAITNRLDTVRCLNLSYGVQPLYIPHVADLSQLLAEMDYLAVSQNWGDPGDVIVVVSALDGSAGHIDTLHIHHVPA